MASVQDDRGYNQGYKLVESTKVRMLRRAEMILSETERSSDFSILEIGCGTGEVAFWIAQRTPALVLATDLCSPFIEDAKRKYILPNLHFEVLNFHDADKIKGRTFDYIIGNGILHHLVRDLDGSLLRIRALLRSGGKIIFLEPNYHNPYIFSIFTFPILRRLARLEPDEMAFTKRYIMKHLTHAGYSNICVDYKDFLIPGVPLIMVKPLIRIGALCERLPFLRAWSQSLFIRAQAK